MNTREGMHLLRLLQRQSEAEYEFPTAYLDELNNLKERDKEGYYKLLYMKELIQ